jgi:hypothetical protein
VHEEGMIDKTHLVIAEQQRQWFQSDEMMMEQQQHNINDDDADNDTTTMITNDSSSSELFVQKLLGQKVICTLLDNRTATGRFICLDRLYVIFNFCYCIKTLVFIHFLHPNFIFGLTKSLFVLFD